MSEEELNFHQDWSACAGRLNGLETANSFLLNSASQHFMNGNDEIAMELRRISALIATEMKLERERADE